MREPRPMRSDGSAAEATGARAARAAHTKSAIAARRVVREAGMVRRVPLLSHPDAPKIVSRRAARLQRRSRISQAADGLRSALRGQFRTSRFPLVSSRVASCTFRAFLVLGTCGILVVGAASCGRRGAESHKVHEAGADQKVHIQLGEGPLDELTVLRGSDGRFVVAGVCLFPENTRLDVSIADSAGALVGRTEVVVEHALIQTLPLGPAATGPPGPAKRYKVEIAAT